MKPTVPIVAHPTPYLYMDLDVVRRNIADFKRHLPAVKIQYAMKCNPDEALLRYIAKQDAGFEVASYPELETLMKVGITAKDVIFSNPVKIESHIADSAAQGLYRFAFDSVEELQKIARAAPGASVYVRIATPAGSSAVASEGKFGIDAATARVLMAEAKKLGLIPYGIAFHVGSQMQNADGWTQAITRAGELMSDLLTDGIRITMLDIGGGFPAHHNKDVPAFAAYGQAIQRALKTLSYEPEMLVAEPGRGLVGDAGVMVATVIGLADRHGKRWVHVDTGAFNGFMEALETANTLLFPLADSRASQEKSRVNLTGPSCDSQDTIMFGCQLSADIAIGDHVFIGAAGAYTTSYASRFNGFDIPAVVYKD